MSFLAGDEGERVEEVVLCDVLPLREQREVIFQLLYTMDASDYQSTIPVAVGNFCSGFHCVVAPDGLIVQRLKAIIAARDELDAEIKPLLHNWRFERLSVATKLILRFALWELLHTELDRSVVINEAIELAKSFAELDAHKFINGLLDEWVKQRQGDAVVE